MRDGDIITGLLIYMSIGATIPVKPHNPGCTVMEQASITGRLPLVNPTTNHLITAV